MSIDRMYIAAAKEYCKLRGYDFENTDIHEDKFMDTVIKWYNSLGEKVTITQEEKDIPSQTI